MAVAGIAALAWSVPAYSPNRKPGAVQVYVAGPPVPSDDNQIFLTLVFAEIERRWNKTLPFEIERLNPDEKHGGSEYQARYLEVLKWIHAEGDIATLVISQEA